MALSLHIKIISQIIIKLLGQIFVSSISSYTIVFNFVPPQCFSFYEISQKIQCFHVYVLLLLSLYLDLCLAWILFPQFISWKNSMYDLFILEISNIYYFHRWISDDLSLSLCLLLSVSYSLSLAPSLFKMKIICPPSIFKLFWLSKNLLSERNDATKFNVVIKKCYQPLCLSLSDVKYLTLSLI